MGDRLKYWAFLSYSHADKRWAKWLHRALEGYSIPRHLIGRTCAAGTIPKKLRPIFRDRDELPVSTDLSVAVRAALQDSRYLIVLCSPDAAHSEWVNQEILEFKAARGEENILCAIVGEAPDTASAPGDPNDGFFPESIRGGAAKVEPMAADLRAGADGKRAGMLKLVAGMLGLGLDELIQRDLHRRQRRLLAITAASLAGMAVMGFLALSAIDSQRDEARQKARAEELVEFMLGELQDQLRPAGSLDTLASLSERALQYYASLKPGDLNAEDKSRRARALLAIGQVENLRGNIEKAAILFNDAFEITSDLLAIAPDNTDRIFDHAQSVYWLGYIDYQHALLDQTESAFAEYLRLSERLTDLEPENVTWQRELASAHGNLGALHRARGRKSAAVRSLSAARSIFKAITELHPDDSESLFLLSNTHSFIADVQESEGDLKTAFDNRSSEAAILEELRHDDPNNTSRNSSLVGAWRALGRLSLGRGGFSAAEQHFSRSVDLGRALRQLDPTHSRWSEITGRSLLAYADLLLWQDRTGEARQLVDAADEIARSLTEQDANVLDWQIYLAFPAELLRARLEEREGDSDMALERLDRLVAGLSGLVSQRPDNRDISSLLAAAHLQSGNILADSDQSESAVEHWRRVVGTLESGTERLPLADRAILALAYLRLGQTEQASIQASELEALGFRHPMTRELRQKVGARGSE